MTHLQIVPPLPAIRHFHHLDDDRRNRLFLRRPEQLNADADRELLAIGLGATLYVPANRPNLSSTVAALAADGICSIVLDLEDAIDDDSASRAMDSVIVTLNEIGSGDRATQAMLFIRVRDLRSINRIVAALTHSASALSGFVIPKFEAATGRSYLHATSDAAQRLGRRLFCMPVLESSRIAHRETRTPELHAVAELLNHFRDAVLAVRIGATDLCGTFGIRRGRDLTIYDVKVVADAIADIVNRLSRCDGTGFVVTAPVWEYFANHERLIRSLLRPNPFDSVSSDRDGLLRELSLDRANGLHGKTVIHPTHVAAVHAFSVVTHEEYRDATDIVAAEAGGVYPSEYRNKMNESRPHRIWAEQVLRRATVFGVANPGITFVDVLTALVDR
jgi:citrate lyase beta subunit